MKIILDSFFVSCLFLCSRLLLGAFENGVEELEDKLLLFTRQELDLLELSLELRLRPGLAFEAFGSLPNNSATDTS